MKKYIPHIFILIVGIVIGALCRGHYFRSIVDNPQRDTIFVRDTFEYTKEVLAESTKVVHQKDTEYIYIEVRDTIVKEKKVYVPMPRQYYHTRVKDAEIFHSGIESRIDSLNIFSTTANITQTYLPKEKKNYLPSIFKNVTQECRNLWQGNVRFTNKTLGCRDRHECAVRMVSNS